MTLPLCLLSLALSLSSSSYRECRSRRRSVSSDTTLSHSSGSRARSISPEIRVSAVESRKYEPLERNSGPRRTIKSMSQVATSHSVRASLTATTGSRAHNQKKTKEISFSPTPGPFDPEINTEPAIVHPEPAFVPVSLSVISITSGRTHSFCETRR